MLLKGAQCVVRYNSVFLGVLPDPMLSELTEGGVIGNWVVVLTGVSFKYYCQVIKLSMEYTQRCFAGKRLKQQPFGGHSEELVHVWEHL